MQLDIDDQRPNRNPKQYTLQISNGATVADLLREIDDGTGKTCTVLDDMKAELSTEHVLENFDTLTVRYL